MKRHLFALGISCIWSCILLYFLWIPSIKIIATPEFQLSDSFHLSYASKYWYAEKLHSTELPIWSNSVGAGFPMLGEGQTGIFYAPNLFLFSTLPVPIAYNISLLLCIVFVTWGTYAWLTALSLPLSIALIGGITFGASGWIFFHLQHICLLQSFSLMPAIFAVTERLRITKKGRYGMLLSLLICEQLFAGFVQAVFITVLISGGYIICRHICSKKKEGMQSLIVWTIAVAGGTVLSAIQFLPMLEFSQLISASKGFSLDKATEFSFPFIHLLTFVYPFILGSLKNGTYYTNLNVQQEVFWEAIGYIGFVPIILVAFTGLNRSLRKQSLVWYILVISCALLMLGKYSPIYLLFTFFPFNLFRVPARFIIPFSFILVTIACFSIQYILNHVQRKFLWIGLLVCAIHILSVALPWYGYHLIIDPYRIPYFPLSSHPRQEPKGYRYVVRTREQSRKLFFTKGWEDPNPSFFLLQDYYPNSNLIVSKATYNSYPSRTLSVVDSYDKLLDATTRTSAFEIDISTASAKLFTLSSVSSFITGIPLVTPSSISQEATQTAKGDMTLFTYENRDSLPIAHAACTIYFVGTLPEALAVIKNPTYDEHTSVLLSKETKKYFAADVAPHESCAVTVTTRTSNDLSQSYEITNHEDFPIIFTQNFTKYPGWEAFLDTKATRILTANIRYRGVIIPPGIHQLTITYAPVALRYGMYLTSFGLLCSTASFFVMRARNRW